MRKVFAGFLASLALLVFSFSLAFAEDESVRLNLRENMGVNLSSPSSSPVRVQNREEVRERVKDMLEGKKLKACRAREEAIKNRKKSLLRLATEALKRMDGWVENLKKFYEEKMVPNGKTVSNYNDLLAEIERTRAEAVASLDKASKIVDEFSCDGDNPKEVYKEFRLAMQETKTKLFEYRKAIKNLLVAMRKVAGEVAKPTPVASPEAE
ncbi:MAG: hypothetical protein CH104c_0344 [Candidatus Woesebacteria bacterium]|nr:MAG: hypothetical protein CH104c_0344 [Candidatus Woesebacteria bacterium]